MDKATLKRRVKETQTDSVAVEIIPKVQITKLLADGAQTPKLIAQASSVIITDNETYAEADNYRAQLKHRIKTSLDGVSKILDPINQARAVLLDLRHKLTDELEATCESLTARMANYKAEERLQLRRLQEARDRESERLRREADAKEEAAARAKTPQMVNRLMEQQAQIISKAEAVESQEEAPVTVAHSVDRVVKKARVISLPDLLMAILEGTVPVEAVVVDQVFVNRKFKENPVETAAWPGVEVYEDTIISGR